jgi:hypothetical protein
MESVIGNATRSGHDCRSAESQRESGRESGSGRASQIVNATATDGCESGSGSGTQSQSAAANGIGIAIESLIAGTG